MLPEDHLIKRIKGFLDQEEGRRLYELAFEASKRGPCLEVGSYCGKSAIYLGMACQQNNSILFSVDHHRGSEEQQPGEEYFEPDLFDFRTGRVDTLGEFRQALESAGLNNTVVPLVCTSEVAGRLWATPLSLVFIDGGHSYESVSSDYRTWAAHIMPAGYLLFHDIFKDPQEGGQAPYQIFQLALESGIFREHSMTKTLGVLQRRQ